MMLIHLKSKRNPKKNVGNISAHFSPSGIKANIVINLYVVNIITKMMSRLKTHNNVLGNLKDKSIEGSGFQTKTYCKKSKFCGESR